MKNRFEAPYQDGLDWMCVSVQSPLGVVKLARKLPTLKARNQRRPGGGVADGSIRQFEPSIRPVPATPRVRSRR